MVALAVPLSFVEAPYPEELVLQHVPTLVGVVLLGFVVWRFQPSRLTIACCLAFLWIHIIGARWIYSFVPYDDWSRQWLGFSISETFGWKRNHYDRLVHFASGLIGLPPISELLQWTCKIRPLHAAILGIACVLAIGAVYEILEWQIAMVFSPEIAESYNGQQGDIWDPQKDLAIAWLGAIIAAGALFRWNKNPNR
jgi:putative membrane protein